MIWKDYDINEDQLLKIEFGETIIWISKIKEGWMYVKQNNDKTDCSDVLVEILDKSENMPNVEKWNTVFSSTSKKICLKPALPDKSLVIQPDTSYKILPRQQVDLFIAIPIWLQIYVDEPSDENLLIDKGMVEFSQTWFGPIDKGEIAYNFKTPLKFNAGEYSINNKDVICRLSIINGTTSILNIQRFCVRNRYFDIYTDDNTLKTNIVNIEFKGENSESHISFEKKSPYTDKSYKLNSARDTVLQIIIRKSFEFIKQF